MVRLSDRITEDDPVHLSSPPRSRSVTGMISRFPKMQSFLSGCAMKIFLGNKDFLVSALRKLTVDFVLKI